MKSFASIIIRAAFAAGSLLAVGACESQTTTTSQPMSTTTQTSPADQNNLRTVAPTAGSMNGNLGGIPRNTMGH